MLLLQAFNTRNPWTISVLNCLAELHQKPDLKPILKVKIEVLCKHLNVELKVRNISMIIENCNNS